MCSFVIWIISYLKVVGKTSIVIVAIILAETSENATINGSNPIKTVPLGTKYISIGQQAAIHDSVTENNEKQVEIF